MDQKPLIEAVERLSEHRTIGAENLPAEIAIAVLPEGKSLVDLQPFVDGLRDAPRRIEAAAKATTIEAFVDYLNRFKRPDSVVFASDAPGSASLLGVVDFHGQGPAADPQFGKHRISYGFPLSEQIKAWSEVSGKALGHAEMASFIADRQHDIATPPLDWMQVAPDRLALVLHLLNLVDDDGGSIDDGAEDAGPTDEGDERYIARSALYKLRQIRFGSSQRLIQLARTVEIHVDAKTVEGYNPKTGERTVSFDEEHDSRDKAGRKISIPDGFLLHAPVFEGETAQLIPVRLQYRRTQGGGVKWFLTLANWQRAVRWAVKTEAERVKKETGLPLFYGAP